jgi:hypothetical protein
MKYHQFFAVIHNQIARFAPDVDVPPEMERILEELTGAVRVADVDPALLTTFSELLGPKYRDLLSQAFLAVKDATAQRIQTLDAARAKLMEEHAKESELARRREEEAARLVIADRDRVAGLQKQVDALTKRLEAIKA